MHIAVFGASGKSGIIFVNAALEDGHTITANIHRTNPFPQHPNLTIVCGDAASTSVVKQTLANADAVVSLVGHGKKASPTMQADVIACIISQMKLLNINRVISLTGTAVRLDHDNITLPDRVVNAIVIRIDPDRIKDGIEHARLLRKSSTDWTIIRVLKLQNIPARPYTLREHGPTKLITSRYEVASAILDLLESGQFIGKSPIISN